jgi:hypothetical protein
MPTAVILAAINYGVLVFIVAQRLGEIVRMAPRAAA